MKTIARATVGVLFLALAGCCMSGKSDGPTAGQQFRRAEQNTGEVLDSANKGIQKGVEGVDKTWETPAEREKREATGNDRRY